MKMTRFEKFFVNSVGRSRRVGEYAETMLGLVGFAPDKAIWTLGAATEQRQSILHQSWVAR